MVGTVAKDLLEEDGIMDAGSEDAGVLDQDHVVWDDGEVQLALPVTGWEKEEGLEAIASAEEGQVGIEVEEEVEDAVDGDHQMVNHQLRRN